MSTLFDSNKCDSIFAAVLSGDENESQSLFDLAQCFIQGYDPGKLHAMLTSNDEGVVSDGLFILGEIGSLARNYLREIDELTRSGDPDLSRKAVDLASIYSKT